MTIIQLLKRNYLIFIRDRAAVFFSLLSMIITITLMAVFLGKMNVDDLVGLLETYGGARDAAADRENAEYLVQLWTIAGILVINSVTVSLTAIGAMVEDAAEKRLMSIYVAPVKRISLALGYVLSGVVISALMCFVTLAASEGYIWMTGGVLPGIRAQLQIAGLTVLNCCVFSAVMYLVALWVKSPRAWSGLATVVGTLVGFLGGIYIPVGTLPDAVTTVMKCLPVLHGTALMKDIFTREAFETVFTGLDPQVAARYREVMGISILIDGKTVNPQMQVLFIAGCGMIAIAAAALCMRYRKSADR